MNVLRKKPLRCDLPVGRFSRGRRAGARVLRSARASAPRRRTAAPPRRRAPRSSADTTRTQP